MTRIRSIPTRLRAAGLLGLLALASSGPALGYESDVHYGLTRWLALRAGFGESHAEAMAVANQRVDGGMVEMQWLNLEYGCAGRLPDLAREFQARNYPSAMAVPAEPAERAVLPGGEAARRDLAALSARLQGKEGLLVGKFGEALHALQDSWSHQGTPSTPDFGAVLDCDARLVSAPPAARGGAHSHAAERTARWPADALAMAKATYEVLLAYPPIEGRTRQPAPWPTLALAVEAFAKADTKTRKRAWFIGQGFGDTGFLGGTSLADGPDPGPLQWGGRKLLPLPGSASTQHDAPADLRAFVDRLLARWLSAERVEDVVADLGPRRDALSPAGSALRPRSDLMARLELWRLRDHGAAAELAHAPAALTAAQLRAVDRLTRDKRAVVLPASPADALFPLLPGGPEAAPLVPYIVRPLPDARGRQRMIAILRFRHAPYDTVGCIVEREGKRWTLVDLVALVDQ